MAVRSRTIDPRTILAVAAGAALGGVLRLLVTQVVIGRFGTAAAPLATAFINVSGSFAIGVVVQTLVVRAHADPLWRWFLATGILGGYTTFSTFSYETLGLLESGFALRALLYVAGSVLVGLAAAFAGVATARAVSPR